MTKKIQPTDAPLPRVRDTSACQPRVSPAQVQEALGAEVAPARLEEALGPITLFAVRQELVSRLQSSGGRPALEGATRRAKVPLSDEEWSQLEGLAATVASPGFAPSAGQVASVLLSLALRSVGSRAASEAFSSSIIREWAARVAAEPDQGPA
jgi:hypothetical protein